MEWKKKEKILWMLIKDDWERNDSIFSWFQAWCIKLSLKCGKENWAWTFISNLTASGSTQRRSGEKRKAAVFVISVCCCFPKKKNKKKLREKKNAQFQNQFEIKIEKRNFEIVRKCLATSSNNNIHVILKTHSSVKL